MQAHICNKPIEKGDVVGIWRGKDLVVADIHPPRMFIPGFVFVQVNGVGAPVGIQFELLNIKWG